MNFKIVKNFIRKIIFKNKKIKNPTIYMTILAKDEADIIEKNIIFHKEMGVDGFIVTDNNSSDGTREIFQKYFEKGWIKEIIDEESDDYQQVKWVDRMIRIAKDKYKADWIINVDADEFWVCKNSNYKDILKKISTNVVKCKSYNILPLDEKNFLNNVKLIKNVEKCLEYELSKFSLYLKQMDKVMHRSKNYKLIKMGNHNVEMNFRSILETDEILIYHYNIRGLNHFKNKMINGGEAVEKNLKLGKEIAYHWRYFYEGFKAGTIDLDEEYKKVIGLDYIDKFEKLGVYEESTVIKDFFLNK